MEMDECIPGGQGAEPEGSPEPGANPEPEATPEPGAEPPAGEPEPTGEPEGKFQACDFSGFLYKSPFASTFS